MSTQNIDYLSLLQQAFMLIPKQLRLFLSSHTKITIQLFDAENPPAIVKHLEGEDGMVTGYCLNNQSLMESLPLNILEENDNDSIESFDDCNAKTERNSDFFIGIRSNLSESEFLEVFYHEIAHAIDMKFSDNYKQSKSSFNLTYIQNDLERYFEKSFDPFEADYYLSSTFESFAQLFAMYLVDKDFPQNKLKDYMAAFLKKISVINKNQPKNFLRFFSKTEPTIIFLKGYI